MLGRTHSALRVLLTVLLLVSMRVASEAWPYLLLPMAVSTPALQDCPVFLSRFTIHIINTSIRPLVQSFLRLRLLIYLFQPFPICIPEDRLIRSRDRRSSIAHYWTFCPSCKWVHQGKLSYMQNSGRYIASGCQYFASERFLRFSGGQARISKKL